jgi:ribosome-associated translation inhibitor RaiA
VKAHIKASDNQTDYAADILADLIIERQLQKIKTRSQYPPAKDNSEEEKW